MAGTVAWQNVYRQTSVQGGDTIANTGAATVFASVWAMPANFLTVGRIVRLTTGGVYGTKAVGPGTLTLDFMAGTTVLASTGAGNLSGSLTNQFWELSARLVCISTGVGGTVEARGNALMEVTLIAENMAGMPNTAVVTLDTTAAQNIGVRVTFGTADIANTITQRGLEVDIGGAQ